MKENVVLNQILDLAQELVQTRGYNAFSYRDLSQKIGIKTSSIHYYFPSKEDLGKAVMTRYRERFNEALSKIDAEVDDHKLKLERYVELFSTTLKAGNRICLCGMLSTDYATLSESIRDEVKGFFRDNEAWLARVLGAGHDAGAFRFEGSPKDNAKALFALLEGAMIGARIFKDEKRLIGAADWLQNLLPESQ